MLSVQPKGKQKGCAGCNRKIKDRYLLKALDKYWHEDCLKCACCDCRLGEVGSTLYTKANLILCRRDYLRWGKCQEYMYMSPWWCHHWTLKSSDVIAGDQCKRYSFPIVFMVPKCSSSVQRLSRPHLSLPTTGPSTSSLIQRGQIIQMQETREPKWTHKILISSHIRKPLEHPLFSTFSDQVLDPQIVQSKRGGAVTTSQFTHEKLSGCHIR